MVATHWNKGWIIENDAISISKFSEITLGRDRSKGNNIWSLDKNKNKPGSVHYIEVTFNTLRNNWDKEHIGSHIVKNNDIFNCEQTGICGSMGAAFSTIENNHIYNIWTKRQFYGFEIGGIKFHAAIDAIIRKNHIHNADNGLWLDWMSQGIRVSSNLFYSNDRDDEFLEVNHGPILIDNNLILSPVRVRNWSEGGAFVHNLIAGRIEVKKSNRFTPYHLAHTTSIIIIFLLKKNNKFNKSSCYGLKVYKTSELPNWINNNNNIYYNGATHSKKDINFINYSEYDPKIKLIKKDGKMYLHFDFDKQYYNHKVKIIST
tara:strand:- start:11085 stop:12035 length:951 start_codon:yes stop_codon:yes gene_type:complete